LPERFAVNAELNQWDRSTFYGGDELGYTIAVPQTSDCLNRLYNPLKYHQLVCSDTKSIEVGHNNSMRHNLVWLMAIGLPLPTCIQPTAVGSVAQNLHAPGLGFIPILTQIGYAVGIFCLFR